MKKLLVAVLLSFLAAATAEASGQAEPARIKIVLTGVVSVKGNDPFTFLALTDDEGKVWQLTGPLAEELNLHDQQARVVLTAIVDDPPVAHGAWPPKAEVKSFKRLRADGN